MPIVGDQLGGQPPGSVKEGRPTGIQQDSEAARSQTDLSTVYSCTSLGQPQKAPQPRRRGPLRSVPTTHPPPIDAASTTPEQGLIQ